METKSKSGSKTGSRASFSGRLGFVLAAAGSAIGLGNIWRFPYLAAKYGGGIFLLVYLIFVLTFGFALIVAENAIGRMTQRSPIGAFRALGKTKFASIGGWINAIIPMLIGPYYAVIGGWVAKYLFAYITQKDVTIAADSYFGNFISGGFWSEFWFIIFLFMTMIVILLGVKGGVEKVSTYIMPLLIFLAIAVSVYSISRPGAVEGVKYFLIPDFKHFSWMTVVTALGQMFYSLSLAMGIMITYGSYLKKDVDINKSTTQIEFFDTLIAILAGLMIIPAVFAYNGADAYDKLNKGPSLMFDTMPKVFADMGLGKPAGILFFLLVLFAALTSEISLAESCVSTLEDELHLSRKMSTLAVTLIYLILGTLSALGYGPLSFIKFFNGFAFLDLFDFITNSVMMPIAAIAICVLVLYDVGLDKLVGHIKESSKFRREKIFRFVIKYLAIPFLLVILVSSVLDAFGVIHM